MTEKQIEKVKKQIRSFRSKLTAEKRKFGAYDDSRGIRFIIADLYLQIQDYKGALRYFNWFEKEFQTDSGFPDFNLAWTITLFKNKKYDLALKKAYTTAFSNTYLFDLILGKKPMVIEKSELINWETLEFVMQIKPYWKRMITQDFKEWLKKITAQKDFKKNINNYIGLQKLIVDEPVGYKRSEMIDMENDFIAKITK